MCSRKVCQWPDASQSTLSINVGRADLVVAGGILPRAHVVDEARGRGSIPSGCQNAAPGASLLEVEELHLAPEAPMVALLGFLEPVQISLELLLVRPGGAV